MFLVCFLSILLLAVVSTNSESPNLPVLVTCSSAIKLTNSETKFKLHSHDIKYGSGSGQQSITAFPHADDPNSYFIVYGGLEDECPRGQPIKCQSSIRLRHMNTNVFLHSHLHESPLSGNQEVSGYESTSNQDDEWKVLCSSSSGFWERDLVVKLQHSTTGKYLSTSRKYTFGNPIPGQMEVSAIISKSGKETDWVAMEGIYFTE
jgi:dolichyl-phosphate-mannose--protein O-mannosyl transferase